MGDRAGIKRTIYLQKKGENGGLPWGSALRHSWNTTPNLKVEDTRTALGNNVHGAPKKGENGGLPWGSALRQSWNIFKSWYYDMKDLIV